MKNICILGGGHGTSRLIKGFKDCDDHLDIIVTGSDNGGHTGEIIKEFDIPAIGDLRMVLESILEKPLVDYFSYRFSKLHGKNNVSLGNLILLSLILENSNDINKMLEIINNEIDKKYSVYLSSNNYVELKGINQKGDIVLGESKIGETENIKDVYFEGNVIVNENVIKAIDNADIIVLSFGSFFTSLGAILANNKIIESIRNSKAKIIYIPNLVNQKETKDFILENYVDYIENKIKRKVDRVLISNTKIKRKISKKYLNAGKKIPKHTEMRKNYEFYNLSVIEDEKIRHNVNYLSQIIRM